MESRGQRLHEPGGVILGHAGLDGAVLLKCNAAFQKPSPARYRYSLLTMRSRLGFKHVAGNNKQFSLSLNSLGLLICDLIPRHDALSDAVMTAAIFASFVAADVCALTEEDSRLVGLTDGVISRAPWPCTPEMTKMKGPFYSARSPAANAPSKRPPPEAEETAGGCWFLPSTCLPFNFLFPLFCFCFRFRSFPFHFASLPSLLFTSLWPDEKTQSPAAKKPRHSSPDERDHEIALLKAQLSDLIDDKTQLIRCLNRKAPLESEELLRHWEAVNDRHNVKWKQFSIAPGDKHFPIARLMAATAGSTVA